MFGHGSITFTPKRIEAEGRQDGEKNIPEMSSYQPAPFEQALVAHGERHIQKIYEKTAAKLAKLQPLYEAYSKHWEDLETRLRRVVGMFNARKEELGRDLAIPFPYAYHIALILFLALGEFPLNTIVFRLFGEPEYWTYVMASTLAITIPLLGMFIGLLLRQAMPVKVSYVIVGVLPFLAVAAALHAVSLLRNQYILSQAEQAGTTLGSHGQMEYALFAINMLVFTAAMVASYFAHDPDQKLDHAHYSLIFLDRRRNKIRKKLFSLATKINGHIKKARSRVDQVRELTNERVSLYRHTNIRHRRLMPPPTFRKPPQYRTLEWWPEVSVDTMGGRSSEA